MAKMEQVRVPDIGQAKEVVVTEILVQPGDRVGTDDSLIVLESDKASMEIPAPCPGIVREIQVKIDDEVDEGDPILQIEVEQAGEEETSGKAPEKATEPPAAPAPEKAPEPSAAPAPEKAPESPAAAEPEKAPEPPAAAEQEEAPAVESTPAALSPDAQPAPAEAPDDRAPARVDVHAGPAVRRLAREYGIDLAGVRGSGNHGRVLKEDLQTHVRERLSGNGGGGGLQLPAMPAIDFAAFGDVEITPISRVRRSSAANLHRSWVTIPHVTHFDEADITELEGFRRAENARAGGAAKLTLLPFVVQCVVNALERYPRFNSSLDPSGEQLIFKRYYNIGMAVATDDGLVVPVLRGAAGVGLRDLAERAAQLAERARTRTLRFDDIQGSTFTVSSLGGIGGTGFTPIINAPEVAVLGVSRAVRRPVYVGDELQPRVLLPLGLSYDHRVIDGAEAAEFMAYLCGLLGDLRRVLL